MTIYTQADSNIRKTWFLLGMFLVLVIGLGYFFSYYYGNSAILYIAVSFSVLQSIVSYWYSDKIILAMTRAKEVDHQENPELYHLLENLTIASGLPQPKFYLLEESQPNAFATGRDPNHAAIVVTRGLLEKLEKPELEGVLAHELSHVGNRDSLVMTVTVILVGIISMMANMFFRIGRIGGRSSDSDSKSSGALALVGLVAVILTPIAATLVQLAISRKREFLADASGALLTRYPEGLARALEKISQDSSPLRVANNSTAHLFIVSPFRGKQTIGWLAKLFSTHPPIKERIAALRRIGI
ncbi:M48 family metallopeptidase [Candidatus Parcubacteria bacterium]|nr:M48 family metallopeptidase [Candidatus Parcubacteria bacterium]